MLPAAPHNDTTAARSMRLTAPKKTSDAAAVCMQLFGSRNNHSRAAAGMIVTGKDDVKTSTDLRRCTRGFSACRIACSSKIILHTPAATAAAPRADAILSWWWTEQQPSKLCKTPQVPAVDGTSTWSTHNKHSHNTLRPRTEPVNITPHHPD